MKWKVSWWIHGAGRICRGHDVVETENMDKNIAEELIEKDLERNGGSFTPNLPKFHAQHNELMCEDRHTSVSNWGVLKVKKVKP